MVVLFKLIIQLSDTAPFKNHGKTRNFTEGCPPHPFLKPRTILRLSSGTTQTNADRGWRRGRMVAKGDGHFDCATPFGKLRIPLSQLMGGCGTEGGIRTHTPLCRATGFKPAASTIPPPRHTVLMINRTPPWGTTEIHGKGVRNNGGLKETGTSTAPSAPLSDLVGRGRRRRQGGLTTEIHGKGVRRETCVA